MSGKRKNAFTLVELLVVIGIIAVLISLLIPVLGAANRQARRLQCSSNLRQLVTATIACAQDHRGYLPLAGIVVGEGTLAPHFLPTALNDPARVRYTYCIAPNTSIKTVLVPLPMAIAPYFGVKNMAWDNWDKLDRSMNENRQIYRLFMCPGTDSFQRSLLHPGTSDNTPVGQGQMLALAFNTSGVSIAWSTNSDYAVNEGVTGYHYLRTYNKSRLRGNTAQIRHANQIVLFTDAKLRKDPAYSWAPDPWLMWTPRYTPTYPATLGDAFDDNGNVVSPDMFDFNRHKRMMNIAYLDGHVEAVPMTSKELSRAYLLPPAE